MNNTLKSWNNLISYPAFEIKDLNESSLFWRVETSHSFYTLESINKNDHGLRISNFYHEPVVVKNGMWGNRLFLEKNKPYTFSLTYHSNVKLYIGLYQAFNKSPDKFWVLPPSKDTISWQDEFTLDSCSNKNTATNYPLYIKIIIPDTNGEFIEINDLYLTQSSPEIESFPEIAVGIVTFNRKKYLTSLLNQIKNINYPSDKIKIFVVDNASSDGTSHMLKQDFPEVTVLNNKENLGGSGGFNRFFKHLTKIQNPPEYGWLIDDDAVIEQNTLLHLIKTLIQDKSIAITGSIMMDLENPSIVYEAGGDLYKDQFGWKANILHTDAGNLTHVNERTWDTGYAGAYSLAFKTDILSQAGIWKNYFLHVDDSEWCLRVQKITGKKVVITLDSLIWHVLRGAKKPFTILRYYETRNFLDFFASTKSTKTLFKVMLQTILMGLKQLVIKREDLFEFHIKGINDFFQNKFGKQKLQRSAIIAPDIGTVFSEYKKRYGTTARKLFLIKEINGYINDGVDHEGLIIEQVRKISPDTTIIETSINDEDTIQRRGDRFKLLTVPLIKLFLFIKMLKLLFFPSKGITVLPFWNEAIVPNNLSKLTAVVEDGKFSIYQTKRMASIRLLFTTLFKAFIWSFKIFNKKFDTTASQENI